MSILFSLFLFLVDSTYMQCLQIPSKRHFQTGKGLKVIFKDRLTGLVLFNVHRNINIDPENVTQKKCYGI